MRKLLKFTKSCKNASKKLINHQIKKCLLFRRRHAVVIMQTLNWTNQCPLFMTVRHIFEISEDDHPWLVTHARDTWWTLDFPNAFVSPGVNSRGVGISTLARRFAPSARRLLAADHLLEVVLRELALGGGGDCRLEGAVRCPPPSLYVKRGPGKFSYESFRLHDLYVLDR
jgi:hypothetical protein